MTSLVGPPGSGFVLNFTANRFTSTLATSQAKNWLVSWGLPTNPALSRSQEWAIFAPFTGNLRRLRVARAVTAADLTFEVEINGTSVISLLLPGGTGVAMASDLTFTHSINKSDYVNVAITAATPDSAAAGVVSATFMLLP